MVSPGRSGLSSSDKRTRKPNSVYAVIPLGAALPRTLISDLPGGFGHCQEPPCRIGPMRNRRLAPGPGFPPYLVLLRVGFTLPLALLPARCALTAPFHPCYCTNQPPKGCPTQWRYVFCGTSRPRVLKPASRTLSGTLPCGVRTFLPRQPLSAVAGKDFRQRPPGPPARL